jgi:hypothetical protein
MESMSHLIIIFLLALWGLKRLQLSSCTKIKKEANEKKMGYLRATPNSMWTIAN